MGIHVFSGRVIDRNTKLGLTGAVVEAHDCGGTVEGPVGSATTAEGGRFVLRLDEAAVARRFGGGVGSLSFRIASGSTVLAETGRAVRWSLAGRRSQSGVIEVDAAQSLGPRAAARSRVDGVVADAAGEPLASVTVEVMRRRLTSAGGVEEDVVASTSLLEADAGRFSLTFNEPKFGASDTLGGQLRVRAMDGVTELASRTLCNPAPHTTVDLTVGEAAAHRYRGLTRHAALSLRITDVLPPVDGPPYEIKDLTPAQIPLVACQLELPSLEVQRVVDAANLALTHPALSEQAFFGLLRRGLPATVEGIFSHRVPVLIAELEAAVAAREVPPSVTADPAALKSALETVALATLRTPIANKLSLGLAVDDTPGVTGAERDALLKLAVNHTSKPSTFWAAVAAEGEISAGAGARFKFTMDACLLSGAFLPVVKVLHARVAASTLADDPRALAAYDATAWRAVIDAIPSDPRYPADTPGATDGSRRDAYAATLARNVEKRFRTSVIRARVAADEPAGTLHAFFTANAAFELETTRIGRFLAEHPSALDTIAALDRPAIVSRLEAIERVYRVTETWVESKALITAGFSSASAIDAAGKDRFISLAIAAGIASDRAPDIFEHACWTKTAAAAIRTKFTPALEKVTLKALPNKLVSLPDFEEHPEIADWTSLFGSPNACSCAHCRSVLSPAAYLVDLLQLLDSVPRAPSGSARDEIAERRPDLLKLALSCANTDTPVPYVDLVNEILEVLTATASWPASPEPMDTAATADELAAEPEALFPSERTSAYAKLEEEVFPLHLPFHRWQEEVRIDLEHLDVRRADLLTLLAPSAGPNLRHLTLERLETSARQLDIIAGPPASPPGPEARAYWGLSAASWPAELNRAQTLMHKGGLSFDQLRELLSTVYCVDAGIAFEAEPPCDLGALDLTGLDSDEKRHMVHRLLRLRAVLGWSISDTDKARAALGGLGAAQLEALGAVRELERRLGVRPLIALAWYSNLDRHGLWARSLFEEVYLDKRVASPADPALSAILATGTSTSPMPALRPQLAAALRLSGRELALLTDGSFSGLELALPPVVAASEGTTDVADETRLSRLFRVVSLARSMRLSIERFLVLRELSGIVALTGDDGASATPEGTLALLDLQALLAAIALPIEEAHALLRHVAAAGSPLVLAAEDVAALRDEPRGAGGGAEPRGRGAGRPRRLAARRSRRELADRARRRAGARARRGPRGHDGALRERFHHERARPAARRAGGTGQRGDREARHRRHGPGRPRAVARALRFPRAASLASRHDERRGPRDARLALRPRPRHRPLRARRGAQLLLGSSARRVRPGRDVRGACRQRRRAGRADHPLPQGGPGRSSLSLAPRALAGALPGRLVGSACRRGPAPHRLERGADRGAGARLGDRRGSRALRAARVDRSAGTAGRALAGRHQLAAVAVRAGGLVSPAGAVFDALAAATGWQRRDVEQVCSDVALDLAESELTTVGPLLRLELALGCVKRLGVAASTAVGWLAVEAAAPPSSEPNAATIAREVRWAARAKHDDASWAKVARPLRDVLRNKQRAALVGHLVHTRGLEGPSDLYRQLLIDVEMEPCALTSRMVLAHGSCQQLVQRILMNLESEAGLVPNAALARSWEWMKSYRVWEANRKVFLWPENWLEPELRDDKTPLFEELERSLLSGPVSEEAAEEAYRRYLDGLADLSNLEIVALHVEQDENSTLLHAARRTVVHVFGRSRKHHTYHYRARASGRWLPWQKLELDVHGEHLMPFGYGGRLYLAWAVVEDVDRGTNELAPTSSGDDVQQAIMDLSLEIARDLAAEGLTPAVVEKMQELEELKQTAANQPIAADPKLPQLDAEVHLRVSELRAGAWTAPLESERKRLGASPARPFLTFLTEVAEGAPERVDTTLRYANTPIVRFSFYPASNVHTAERLAALDDPLGSYGRGIIATVDGAQPAPFTTPAGFGGSHQAFFRNAPGALRLYLTTGGDTLPAAEVLETAPGRLRLVADRAFEPAGERPFLIAQDTTRAFTLELRDVSFSVAESAVQSLFAPATILGPSLVSHQKYRLDVFHHPQVESFRHAVASRGLRALLSPSQQQGAGLQKQSKDLTDLEAGEFLDPALPLATDVDFRHASAYGVYNWELFFHIPLRIARAMQREGRHEEARRWLHAVFDPSDGSTGTSVTRFWKFRPFAENPDLADIQAEVGNLAGSASAQELGQIAAGAFDGAEASELTSQIAVWRANPFEPHAIARMRTVAYQKAVVLAYVDNLVAWADSLFGRDTIESINEATQLYLLAQELLGERPVLIPDPALELAQSYGQLDAESAFDAFSNALAGTEVLAPPPPKHTSATCGGEAPPPNIVWGSAYFCVPPNERLLGSWDLIADRLFKIRHCRNLEGVARSLPLFEPPIDPALLVRAAAAGLDLGSVVADLRAGAPFFRFSVLYAKAVDLAGHVASLGNAALAVLERRDAEELARLRQGHEIATYEAMRDARRAQLGEARESLRAAERGLLLAQERFDYYSTREAVNASEEQAMALRRRGHKTSIDAQSLHAAAAQVAAIPDFVIGTSGWAGSPVATSEMGGSLACEALTAQARTLEVLGSMDAFRGDIVGTMAGYGRRKDDWDHQARLAALEIRQLERQVEAARLRVEVARHELTVVERQAAQSREVEQHLRLKFTSSELYDWMKGELSALHRSAYQLAFDMARRAEKAFQIERGDPSQTFVRFGHWDSLRQGLTAGDKLLHDLRRMDAAYVAQAPRELEIVKLVSLAEHDPAQLVALRETGTATLTLTEDDFDRDFSGHYLRRIKSVALTIPCTSGPYQGVFGALHLLKAGTRPSPSPTGEVELSSAAIQSIVTSHGQSDSGLFELSFRDERLLPFEGLGAHLETGDASPQWQIELSPGNRFAYDSIDDAVLEIRYTARGGSSHEGAGTRTLRRLIRVPQAADLAWAAYQEGAASIAVELPTSSWARARNEALPTSVASVTVYVWGEGTSPTIAVNAGTPVTGTVPSQHSCRVFTPSVSADPTEDGTWTITPSGFDSIDDLWVVVELEVTVS